MKRHLNLEWKNFLRISLIPLVSLLALLIAVTSFANGGLYSLDADHGFFQLQETRKVEAPGLVERGGQKFSDQPGQLRPLEYYRWVYQVAPIVYLQDLGSDIDAGFSQLILAKEEEALSKLSFSREDLSQDAAKRAQYETELAERFLEDMRGGAPGPYQEKIWDWYRNEVNYEKSRSEILTSLGTTEGQIAWLVRYLARKKAEQQTAQASQNFERTRQGCVSTFASLTSTPRALQARCQEMRAAETQFNQAFQEAQQTETQKLEADAALLAQELATPAVQEALAAYKKSLEDSPVFRPEIQARILAAPNHSLIDVETARLQAAEMDSRRDSPIPTFSTVGFDGYAIINADIDAVLAAYQFRNGRSTEADALNLRFTQVYPMDGLFNYRREESLAVDHLWGPGAFYNISIKQAPSITFVDPILDAYAVLVRGNREAGYDVLFQLLGRGCPVSIRDSASGEIRTDAPRPLDGEGDLDAVCRSGTRSNFTMLILRPLPDGKTAYKISGRFVGQSYSSHPNGVSSIGFSPSRFQTGQMEFIQQALTIDASRKRLQQASQRGLTVRRLDSATTAHFLNRGQVQHLPNPESRNARQHFPILPQQGFYEVLGERAANEPQFFQVLPERGSLLYRDGVSMMNYPIKNLR